MPDLDDSFSLRVPDTVLLHGRRPYTAALQLAAGRTIDELEARIEDGSRIALAALGEVLILKALKADVQAHTLIAERLEGRVGVRMDEIAPEAAGAREAVGSLIGDMVAAFTAAKLAAGDDGDGVPAGGALAATADDEVDAVVPSRAGVADLDPSVERWRGGEAAAWDRRA